LERGTRDRKKAARVSVQGGRPHRDVAVAVAVDAASLHSFTRLWRHYEAELANDLAARFGWSTPF
jgi:hypothetical protein